MGMSGKVGRNPRSGRSRNAVRLVAVAALVTAGIAVMPAPASAAPGQFRCAYTFTAWPGGFTADLLMTNVGPTVESWRAHWTTTTPTLLGGVWSATMTQQATALDAVNLSWNGQIKTGSSAAFGWTAIATSTSVPTDITVNGQPC